MPKKKSFKEMRVLASKLPVQFQDADMFVKGSQIIEARKGKNCDDIDASGWYRVPVERATNHYRRIKRIFTKQGYDAVLNYVNETIQAHRDSLVNHSKVLAGLPQAPMYI